jgi:hypothetical protein
VYVVVVAVAMEEGKGSPWAQAQADDSRDEDVATTHAHGTHAETVG